MSETKKQVYDESKIKTLSSLEHIRLRTGMYIGRIGDVSHYDEGCYVLPTKVIDSAMKKFIMGRAKEIQISIEPKSATAAAVDRGIPLAKSVTLVSWSST